MGSSEEAFCLKWNDFQKSVTSSFAELRRDSNLTDVTVVVEGTHLKAHKVILSACSGAFKELFRSGISKEPVIMLWDVSAEDMEALFNFMYQGQVNVVQERLNTFLDLAERLRVKGLTNKSPEDELEEDCPPSSKSPRRSSSSLHSRSNTPSSTPNDAANRKRLTGSSPSSSNNSIKKPRVKDESDESEDKSVEKTHPIVMIKQEGGKASAVGGALNDGSEERPDEMEESSYVGDYSNEYFDTEGDQFTADDMIQGTSHDFANSESNKESRHENCSWCNRSFRNLNQHIDDIHLATPTPCPLCGKIFSSKPKMLKHKTLKHHGESRNASSTSSHAPSNQGSAATPCNCPYCGKFFDSRQGMNGHTAHCTLRPKSLLAPNNNNNGGGSNSSGGGPSFSEPGGGPGTSSNNMGSGLSMSVCPDCGRLFQSKHQMYGHRAHCKARVPPPPKKNLMPPLPTQPLPVHQAMAGMGANAPPEEGFELLDKGNMIWVE